MPRYKLMIVRFPYGGSESSEGVDWLIRSTVKLAGDPRFDVQHLRINDTPITMTRNDAFEVAKREGVDFLLCIDSDMAPDIELKYGDPDAKPFLETTIEFMLKHEGPCVVAAPYCGPPPHENIYVFQWTNKEGDHPNSDCELVQFTREEAAKLRGITEVAALPTGLMVIDMRALRKIAPPYTYYEWEDDRQHKKASTEDVTLTRDLSLAGVPVYCNWDAWAGHIKRKIVRKPRHLTADHVAERMHEAILQRRKNGGQVQADVKPQSDLARAEVEAALKAAEQPVEPAAGTGEFVRDVAMLPGASGNRPYLGRSIITGSTLAGTMEPVGCFYGHPVPGRDPAEQRAEAIAGDAAVKAALVRQQINVAALNIEPITVNDLFR